MAEIESVKVGIGEGEGPPCAEAKVDGIKDRGLAAVARADQAIYPRPRQPAKAFDRPKVVDLKHADQRHTASPRSFAARSAHGVGGSSRLCPNPRVVADDSA
jgi:hypothetical protein